MEENESIPREIEVRVTKLTDERIEQWLGELEQKYGMSSSEFLLAYNTGKLGDDDDFIDWSGLLWVAAKVGLRHRAGA